MMAHKGDRIAAKNGAVIGPCDQFAGNGVANSDIEDADFRRVHIVRVILPVPARNASSNCGAIAAGAAASPPHSGPRHRRQALEIDAS